MDRDRTKDTVDAEKCEILLYDIYHVYERVMVAQWYIEPDIMGLQSIYVERLDPRGLVVYSVSARGKFDRTEALAHTPQHVEPLRP